MVTYGVIEGEGGVSPGGFGHAKPRSNRLRFAQSITTFVVRSDRKFAKFLPLPDLLHLRVLTEISDNGDLVK
jgi:hypothetical protein